MRTRRRQLILATLASLLVYAIPIVGPHAFTLIGEFFFQSQGTGGPAWRAMNIGAAMTLQAAAFATFYWFFSNPGLARGVVVGVAALVALVESQRVFFIYIPTMFLIEDDTRSEAASWSEVCSTADGHISSVPTPEQSPDGVVSEVLLQMMNATYATMAIPGCAITALPLPQPKQEPNGHVNFMLGVDYFVAGKTLLVNQLETATSVQAWSVLRAGQSDLLPVQAASKTGKILSNDGEWIAWIEPIPGSQPPIVERVVIHKIAGNEPDVQTDLSASGPAIYALVNIDTQKREIVLSRNRDILVTTFDGQSSSTIHADGVEPVNSTFKRSSGGWVAWDATPDHDPYRVVWSLPAGSGSHRVLKGRSINSVAVSPDSELIAISVATALNIGHIQDAIYVLRARDGSEIFRRYLPTYTRTPVLFPSNDLFLYSAGSGTHLLHVMR
jgi:hypothetical protein